MNLAAQFDGRPVFVTGADGFVGSHLTERFVKFGADVHVFVRATLVANSGKSGTSARREMV